MCVSCQPQFPHVGVTVTVISRDSDKCRHYLCDIKNTLAD